MWSKTILVSKRSACFRKRCIRSGPMHAVDVGRPVVDVGRGHQLAALGDAGDQHRLQVGAGGVEGGGVAGGPGAEDQDAGVLRVGGGHGVRQVGSVSQRRRRQSDMGARPEWRQRWSMATIAHAAGRHDVCHASPLGASRNLRKGSPMSMLSNLDLIRRVPLFSMLTNEQAQGIADSVVKRRFRRGEIVVEHGQEVERAVHPAERPRPRADRRLARPRGHPRGARSRATTSAR